MRKIGEILKGDVMTKRMLERVRLTEEVRAARDEARQELAFTSLPFVLCGMPVKRPPPEVTEHVRHNGNYFLKILCDSKEGLPFGQDRLLPIWIATQAVRRKSRTIDFSCPAELMSMFRLPQDGPHYKRLLESFRRVFHSHIVFGTDRELVKASKIGLWLDSYRYFDSVHMYAAEEKKDFDDLKLPGRIVISETFAKELERCPVPLDLAAVRILAPAPAQLDFFVWLCHRSGYAKESVIPLHGPRGLSAQLGASENLADRNFRVLIKQCLAVVKDMYPDCPARLTPDGKGLVIAPWRPVRGRQLSLMDAYGKPIA